MKLKLLIILFAFTSGLATAQFEVNQPGNLTACSNSDFAAFDLTSQNSAILGMLPPQNYTITYHTSSAAANNDTGAISNPQSYTNIAEPQPIWARIELNSNPSNYEIAEFFLNVNVNPMVFGQEFSTCDNDANPSDGIAAFDLEEIAEAVYSNSGLLPTEVELSFYETESDAMNQVNALTSPYTNLGFDQVIYVNAMSYETSCTSIAMVYLITLDCTGSCNSTIDDIVITGSGGDSVSIGWTSNGAATQWEVLMLPAGGPFPLPTMDGEIVEINPVIFSGLDCPESYDIYVRARCGTSYSDWTGPAFYQCGGGGEISDPVNLTACAEGGTACFNLTLNDAEALNIDPLDFVLTYHTSAASANAGTNPIENPEEYCTTVAMGADEIFIRIQNIDSDEFEVVWFTVTAQEIVINPIPLQQLVACDEDQNGSVTFNLTDAATQLETDNPLVYYNDLEHALDQNDPITSPEQYVVATQNSTTTIYIRETVEGSCDIIHSVHLSPVSNCNFSNVCAGANSLCNALGVPFPNTVGIEEAESENSYGCLSDTPNPTWFYLPISSAGTINLIIEQNADANMQGMTLDVDYIVYGPYTDPVTPCSGQLTSDKIVSCSYSADFAEYPVIPNAQPGQFYLIMATNYSDNPGYIRISELSTSQGDIDCTGLRMTVFIDSNTNGIKDGGESNFGLGQFHYVLNDNAVMHNITSPTGVHKIYDSNAANSYDLSYTIDPEYLAFYGITTASFSNVHVVANAGMQEYMFPITITQAYNDVSITVVPNEAPRPGFIYENTVIYTNLGGQTVPSGTVIFHKDPMVSITSVSLAGATITANGFTYNYTDLAPFETRMITVAMQVPTIPTVMLGDLLTNDAEILPFAGDLHPENNSSEVTQEVIGSYDPNDKMESRGNQILFSDFTSADYLYYTIRFENTGTASAININVTDVLDSQLDESSVRMVSASHNYVLDRVGSQLNWKFENIILPPVSPDSEDGHGYITFKVKPDPGYAVGDIINNTANIYFDFNPAIVTNTFASEFVNALAIADFTAADLSIYPNPASGFVNVQMRNGESIAAVALYDISGKVILNEKGLTPLEIQTLNVSDIAAGIYFVEITTDTNKKLTKKLIIR
ncbi:MAG TPA: T9SS type A sorting domain-containing protein [Flavobacterium sp.]|jgi:uncharacterized repeat protein (TIGR01451 family)